ncbi:MAG: HAD family hydrolase [Planctomycetota bacterium]
MRRTRLPQAALLAWIGLLVLPGCGSRAPHADPLPSWNDGPTRSAIVQFVQDVTEKGGAHYVLPQDRIATFDNDGTLWTEQPNYAQALFVADRIRAMAPQHPEWKTTQPYQAVLEQGPKGLLSGGMKGLETLLMTTHAGMTTAEFEQIVTDWIATARHPRFDRPYTEMVYEPMLELLAYLRANGFKTFIVSAGGIEFMRPWTERTYGIPPQQVVGSRIETRYEVRDGKPVLVRLPKVDFIDDKDGKPIGINAYIGKRPILAFGNSDGDRQMLEWTQGDPKVRARRLMALVHHTDAEREVAYGPRSKIGTFSDALMKEANERGWLVVDMKRDWKRIFPPE